MSSDTVRIWGYIFNCSRYRNIGKHPSRRSPSSMPPDIQLIFAPDKTTSQSGLCHMRHPIWKTHWRNIFKLHLVGKQERLLFAQNAESDLEQLVRSTFPVLILFLRGALVFTKSPLGLYFGKKCEIVPVLHQHNSCAVTNICYFLDVCCSTKIGQHRYFNFNINIKPISQNWRPSL